MTRTAMILGRDAHMTIAAVATADLAKVETAVLADPETERRFYAMPDAPPDRISIERRSPFYDAISANLGVRIDGIEQDSVVEYCRSENWARIGERDHRGKLIYEYDHYRARKVEGVTIEPYWKVPLSRQQRRARAAKARKA